MRQKVHWTTKEKYSQSFLVRDDATGLAWLHDRDEHIIKPSSELTIHAGPRAIRKPIYKGAIRTGNNVKP